MEQPLIHVSPRHFFSAAAELIAAPARDNFVQLGDITLMRHQQEAVDQIERAFRCFGGALLADDTGLGKTFVALAVAARRVSTGAGRVIVIAPAALRSMWLDAASRAGVQVKFMSVEGLSGSHVQITGVDCDLLIIDEAHHLRNALTRRFAQAASLSGRANVLLLSATPVHNNERELQSILSLFMGSRARSLSQSDVAQVVIRREQQHLMSMPSIPVVVHGADPGIPQHDEILDAILSLPPHVPAVDAGDAGVLLTFTLIRQWASSFAALERALSRRLAQGIAMLSSLENEVLPTVADLRSWCTSPDAVQLPLFGLFTINGRVSEDMASLRSTVDRHVSAVGDLLSIVRNHMTEVDGARWDALQRIRAQHAGEKVLCFTQFAETASAMFRLSRRAGRSALLTASGGLIASGSVSRDELVRMFAPRASGAAEPERRSEIDLLLSTDLLSEGVNLQDASVLVHLDIPWTPVRLTQRVGRLARTGSFAKVVTVYTFPPPASAESLLKMERRLAAKLSVASRTVGVAGTVLPLLHIDTQPETSPPQLDARIRAILASMIHAPSERRLEGAVMLSALQCDCGADFLVLVRHGGRNRLLAGSTSGIDENQARVAAILERVLRGLRSHSPVNAAPRAEGIAAALDVTQRWLNAQRAKDVAGLDIAPYARARRKLLRRIDSMSRRAPAHTRPHLHELSSRARRVAAAPLGHSAEQVLAELADAQLPDEAWLRAIDTFVQTRSRTLEMEESIELLGIVLLQ